MTWKPQKFYKSPKGKGILKVEWEQLLSSVLVVWSPDRFIIYWDETPTAANDTLNQLTWKTKPQNLANIKSYKE